MTKTAATRRPLRGLVEVLRDAAHAFRVTPWRGRWPKFSRADSDAAAAFLDEHGWVIIRSVFSDAEISRFREAVGRSRTDRHRGDLLSDPHLAGFVVDERILSIVRGLLGAAPCYFGDSSASVDSGEPVFHKDNPDKDEPAGPDWQGRYSLLRVGLYLQDHTRFSGGLAIRDRSHCTAQASDGRPIALPTEVGDIAVWFLRTTHSGFALRPRIFPNVFVPIPLVRYMRNRHLLSRLVRPQQHDHRMALFATYGVDDQHLSRYLSYLQTRQYAVQIWQASAYDTATLARARQAGLGVVSMRERVATLDAANLNAAHKAIPFDAPLAP